MQRLVVLLLLIPASAIAGMSAEEFEAYTSGQTLTYFDQGTPYGTEEYRPNRRVRWAFIGGQCTEGFWYDSGAGICFVYEHDPEVPQCWEFLQEGGRLTAMFLGDDDGRELYEAERSDEPMTCLGPDVGV